MEGWQIGSNPSPSATSTSTTSTTREHSMIEAAAKERQALIDALGKIMGEVTQPAEVADSLIEKFIITQRPEHTAASGDRYDGGSSTPPHAPTPGSDVA